MALVPKGARFLFDFGYFQVNACARLAAAGADVLSRLNPPTTRLHREAERWQPLEGASLLPTVAAPCGETPILLGAKERGACRLLASRVPEPLVHASRRHANQKATKKGYPPSTAPRALLAWTLFLTHVPHTIGKMEAVCKASPLRWHIALLFKSWKRYWH